MWRGMHLLDWLLYVWWLGGCKNIVGDILSRSQKAFESLTTLRSVVSMERYRHDLVNEGL
jgi:hypothetical protein